MSSSLSTIHHASTLYLTPFFPPQATVLIISPKPHILADFWSYLTTHDADFSSPEARKRLSERLLDVLLKQLTLIGAPQTLGALIPLAKRQMADEGRTAEDGRGELELQNL